MMTYRPVRYLLLLGFAAALVVPFGASAGAAAHRPPASGPNCGPTIYQASRTPWVCTFADDFDGSQLDASKWLPVTTAANGQTGGGACFVNSPDNISVGGGYLSLTVRRTAAPFACATPSGSVQTQYTSGQVATYGKFSQTYGRFAVRAKFPAATVAGLQSSLWMWPQNNYATGLTGEIDIAEEYSGWSDRVVPYLHYAYNPSTANYLTGVNVVTNNYCMVANVNAFHEYAVVWTPSTFTITFDGQTCLVDRVSASGPSPFNQPYFVALTQALGVAPNAFSAATPLPATTTIDWVRVWK